MAKMSVLTFDDLTQEIDKARDRANSPSIKDSWAELRKVVGKVAGITIEDDLDPSTDESPWWLTRAEIHGFRGIPPQGLTLELPPTPGLTVIHGPNGSGKSSICHGIDVGLHQDWNASVSRWEGTGGQHPVWEPVLVNGASTAGIVSLELRNDDGRVLKTRIELGEDQSASGFAEIARPGQEPRPITLGPKWKSAVTAGGPTYAYSSWEQHIQRAQDLQVYLERMLVLGGCFTAVAELIQNEAASAHEAKGRVDAATRLAETAVSELETTWNRSCGLTLPTVAEDPDAWWAASGLPDPAAGPKMADPELSIVNLTARASEARARLNDLQRVGEQGSAAFSALRSLDNAADALDAEACPVCGSRVAWRGHLHAAVQRDEAASGALDAWGGALAALLAEADASLPRLLKAAEPRHETQLSTAVDQCNLLRHSRDIAGAASSSVVESAKALLALLASEEFRREAEASIARCSEDAAWAAALATALQPLCSALSADRLIAEGANRWDETTARLADLEKRLKKQRQSALEQATNEAVVELLGDAGISVDGLSVQKRQADLVLRDKSGSTLRLGMVSAGQRNAILLAPALAVAEAGPFGFMIVDDPVHSFDELRVDYIARQLIRISALRRVVVLTHDERLKEHLMAAPSGVDLRSIQRNPTSGEVEIVTSGAIWQVLLEDAANLRNLLNPPAFRLGMTNTLRGLCRQAFDSALRLFVTQEAISLGANAQQWLSSLDGPGVAKTADRIEAAAQLPLSQAGRARLDKGRALLPAPTLLAWNMASHGNEPKSAFDDAEIHTARTACKALFK